MNIKTARHHVLPAGNTWRQPGRGPTTNKAAPDETLDLPANLQGTRGTAELAGDTTGALRHTCSVGRPHRNKWPHLFRTRIVREKEGNEHTD